MPGITGAPVEEGKQPADNPVEAPDLLKAISDAIRGTTQWQGSARGALQDVTGVHDSDSSASAEADPKAKPKAKKKAAKETGPTAAEIEKEIAANPFAQMGQGLVKGLEAQEAPVEQAVSGALTQPATQSALQTAFAAAGLSPTSAAGQLVESNIAQGEKNEQPLQQAMAAYGTAFDSGQKTVDQALTNLGQANALGVATAPEQQWLTGLQSHIQEQLAYQGYAPNSTLASMPPALLYYLQQSGTPGATGTTPLTDITLPKADESLEPVVPGVAKKAKNPVLNAAGAAPSASSIASDTGSAPS